MVELLLIAAGLALAGTALTLALQLREERLERERIERLRRALQNPVEGPWTP